MEDRIHAMLTVIVAIASTTSPEKVASIANMDSMKVTEFVFEVSSFEVHSELAYFEVY